MAGTSLPLRATNGVVIHPLACVDPSANVGEHVIVGPFAVIEAHAVVGDRTHVMAHAHVAGASEIGSDCEIYMGAVVGAPAQVSDRARVGGRAIIGSGTIIREHVTVHRAREEGTQTTIGRRVFLMAGCHVAHDCVIGDDTVIANGALLAGWVQIGGRVFVSGNVAIHQFVRVGELALISGQSRVSKDVPPYMIVAGDSVVRGVNVVGMRRAGMRRDERQAARTAFRILYRSGLGVTHALARLYEAGDSPVVGRIATFIQHSARGICAGGPRGRRLLIDRRDLPAGGDD